ncbi:hypothetical protein NC651_012050 [Populus alba x Populus x berolinensis]|nr:hypothetical protein NC651_012050 [Populus alba x Populus x berolinensis]
MLYRRYTPRLEELKLYRIQQETKASTDQSEVSGMKIAREKRKGWFKTATGKESPSKRTKTNNPNSKEGG